LEETKKDGKLSDEVVDKAQKQPPQKTQASCIVEL